MNNVWALASTLLLLCGPHTLLHAEASEPSVNKHFSVGAAVGYHDADTDDSADPHVNGYTYSLLVGYDWSRYVAFDAEVTRMNRGSDLDVFGRRLSFGADVVGLSGRIQWPLDDSFTAYLRVGAAALELDDPEVPDGVLDESWVRPMYGGGVRGNYWFAEFVYYGKLEDLYLDQVRAGLILRF
jgi:hypothetical protein